MARLITTKLEKTAAAAEVSLPFLSLGHVRLRFIQVRDRTRPIMWTADIMNKDTKITIGTYDYVSIFQYAQQIDLATDIIWEGDLEIQNDQLLHVWTQGATVSDFCVAIVGYEMID